MISTRLFFCRPSGSSEPSACEFGAISLDFPSPRMVNREAGSLAFLTSQSRTEAARLSESALLYASAAMPSV